MNDVTNRGYTGHEMDDEIGLINMNARIYDPYLGKFLSADPVLPDSMDMQAFNRYSYVLNNPLKYTDPTGHSPDGGFTVSFVVGFFFSAGNGSSGGCSGGSEGTQRCGAEQAGEQSYEYDEIEDLYGEDYWVRSVSATCDVVSGDCDPSDNAGDSVQGEGVTLITSIRIEISFGSEESDKFSLNLSVGLMREDGRCSFKICFTGSQSKNQQTLVKWQGVLARYAATQEGASRLFSYFTDRTNINPFVIGLRTTADTVREGRGTVYLDGARASFAARSRIEINVDAQNSSLSNSLVYPGENGTWVGSELRVFAHESFHALASGERRNNENFAILSANTAVLQDAIIRGVPEQAGVRVGHRRGRNRNTKDPDSLRE